MGNPPHLTLRAAPWCVFRADVRPCCSSCKPRERNRRSASPEWLPVRNGRDAYTARHSSRANAWRAVPLAVETDQVSTGLVSDGSAAALRSECRFVALRRGHLRLGLARGRDARASQPTCTVGANNSLRCSGARVDLNGALETGAGVGCANASPRTAARAARHQKLGPVHLADSLEDESRRRSPRAGRGHSQPARDIAPRGSERRPRAMSRQ
jgi:hypothetical protein